MDRTELIRQISDYAPEFPEESIFPSRFQELLRHPHAYYRDHLPGHLTGSAWILNHDHSKVLLLLHGKLERWMQPGGHADGDENIAGVALREAEEETGLSRFKMVNSSVFDLDIHPIPARVDFPEHLHYDVRFLFEASDNDLLTISEESKELKWIDLSDVARLTSNASSVMRMVLKTRNL